MTKEEQDNASSPESDGNVEDGVSETETPAPEPVTGKASTLASVQASVQDALSTASKWGGAALYSSRDAFSTVGKWKEEGNNAFASSRVAARTGKSGPPLALSLEMLHDLVCRSFQLLSPRTLHDPSRLREQYMSVVPQSHSLYSPEGSV